MTIREVKFRKTNPADDADVVLEEAKDNYESVLVVGYDKEGMLDVRVSTRMTVEEAHFLCAKVQQIVVNSSHFETVYEE